MLISELKDSNSHEAFKNRHQSWTNFIESPPSYQKQKVISLHTRMDFHSHSRKTDLIHLLQTHKTGADMLQGCKMSKKQEWKPTASERQRKLKKQEWKPTASERQRKLKKSELLRIIYTRRQQCRMRERREKVQHGMPKQLWQGEQKGMLWKQDYTPQVKSCNIPQSCQRKEIPPTVQGHKGLPLLI